MEEAPAQIHQGPLTSATKKRSTKQLYPIIAKNVRIIARLPRDRLMTGKVLEEGVRQYRVGEDSDNGVGIDRMDIFPPLPPTTNTRKARSGRIYGIN